MEYAAQHKGFIYQNPDTEKVRQLLARNELQLPTPLKLSDSDIRIAQNPPSVKNNISENSENDTQNYIPIDKDRMQTQNYAKKLLHQFGSRANAESVVGVVVKSYPKNNE